MLFRNYSVFYGIEMTHYYNDNKVSTMVSSSTCYVVEAQANYCYLKWVG